MSRLQWIALCVLVPIVIVGGLWLGGATGGSGNGSSGALKIAGADDATEFAYDFTIPPGTSDQIAAGQDVEIVPAELVVKVGEAIRIVNNDSEDHVVGVFFVASGETLTQRFNSVGVLEGECDVHPSGSFTLRVEA
jgi:plastocyanin